MRVYLVYAGIVAWVCGFMLFTGCGGRHGLTLYSQFPELNSANRQLAHANAGGLKTKVELNYSLTGFPSLQGITVVPLVNESTAGTDKERYTMSVEVGKQDPSTRTVTLSAPSAQSIMAHLRYDPAVWGVKGVASLNPWEGTEQFLPVAVIVEPGALLLHSIPLGIAPSAKATAHGEFAQVILEPASRKNSSFNAVTDSNSITVAWDVTYDENSKIYTKNHTSVLSYRMDGKLADLSTKDGEITGTELLTSVADSLIHPTIFYGMPHAFVKDQPWVNVGFTFKECLPGDCNNNGYVTLSDLTEIALHLDSDNTSYEYGGMKGMHPSESGAWLNLDYEMKHDGPPSWNWHKSLAPNIDAFWYLDQLTWDDPTDYVKRDTDQSPIGIPSTHIINAMDSDWDGVVYNWQNIYHIFPPGYGGVYDEPENNVYRPGDLGPLSKHWDEAISGYRVYTVTRDAQGQVYDPENAPPLTPPDEEVCINATNWYRPGMSYPDFDTLQELPGPDAISYTKPYFDESWSEYNEDSMLWKSELDQSFQELDFYGAGDNVDLSYDILIYPYLYADNAVTYGPCSRISDAFTYLHEDSQSPYFVEPGPPPDPQNPPAAASDFLLHSRGYEGAVAVWFRPAVDPPSYNSAYDLTYECYWSTSPFDEDELLNTSVHQVAAPIAASYSDIYSTSEYPPFNPEYLVYIIDNDGEPFDPGTTVYFYVRAVDGSDNASPHLYPAEQVVPSETTAELNPTGAIILTSDVSDGQNVPGSLASDDNDIYAVYPSGYDTYTGASVNYQVFPDGAQSQPPSETADILSSASYPFFPVVDTADLSLALRLATNGDFERDGTTGLCIPMMAHSGIYGTETPPTVYYFTTVSTVDSSGSWTNHCQLENTSDYAGSWNLSGQHALRSVVYTDAYEPSVEYCLGWIYAALDNKSASEIRSSHSAYATVWPIPPGAFDTLDTTALNAGTSSFDMANTDYRAAKNYHTTTSQPLPVQRLYGVMNQRQESGSPPIDRATSLYVTENGSTWRTSQDIDGSLLGLTTDSTVSPVLIQAVSDPITNDTTIYIAYNSAAYDDIASDDGYGLRCTIGVDNGNSVSSWNDYDGRGLIADDYLFASMFSTDLQIKPEARISSYAFDRLGAAFTFRFQPVSGENEPWYHVAYISESVGNGDRMKWMRIPIIVDTTNSYDICWIKLIYRVDENDIAIPYAMYCMNSKTTHESNVYMWRLGGFS